MPKPNSKPLSSIFASAVENTSNKKSKSTSSSKLATLTKLTYLTTTEKPSKKSPSKKLGSKNAAPCGDSPIQYLKDMSSLISKNYLLALCKNDMQKEILQLLELVDVTTVSSLKFLTDIFSSLGRLALESYVEKFILAFRLAGTQEEKISSLIYNYAISIPNLEVEEVVSKFKSLHKKLEGRPSSASHDNLITYCCDLQKAVINTEGNSGWEELVESRLEDEYDNQELNGMAALAYRCIDSSPINRPSMKDIVQELSQIRSYRNNRAMLEEVPISKYTQDIQNPVAEDGGEEADDTTQVRFEMLFCLILCLPAFWVSSVHTF